MAAAWMRFGAELRTRWRAWLALGLLIGIAAGAVLVLVAGARRTSSAYARFLDAERPMVVAQCPKGARPRSCDLAQLARLPGVGALAPFLMYGGGQVVAHTTDGRGLQPNGDPGYTGPGELFVLAGTDLRFGTAVQREKILDGRPAVPGRAGEATVNFALAERVGLEVGDRLRMRFAVDDGTGKRHGDVASAATTRAVTVRIVGIEVAPLEVPPPSGQWEAGIHLTPAFARRAVDQHLVGSEGVAVWLRDGATVGTLRSAVAQEHLGFKVFGGAFLGENVERGIHPQVIALAIVAALAGLVALALFGAALVRLTVVETADAPTLVALGMGHGGLWGVGALRATAIGACAALAGITTAFLASPLMPIGLARTLEPEPGWTADASVLAIGAVATFGLVVLVGALASWRSTRVVSSFDVARRASGAARPSLVEAAVTHAWVPVTTATGARMALQPGQGPTVVPVRSTIAALAVALAAVLAALGFSANLGHLLSTPRLSGWNWDFAVPYPYERGPNGAPVAIASRAKIVSAFAASRGVRAVAPGILFRPFASEPALELGPDRVGVEILAFGPGDVGPTVIQGRAPRAAGEILVGPHTLTDLGAEIGDRVRTVGRVRDPGSRRVSAVSTRLRIVGTGVVPLSGGEARLGRGATLTIAGVRALAPDAVPDVLWVRLGSGAHPVRTMRAVGRSLGLPGAEHVRRADLIGYQQRGDVAEVSKVDDLPLVLAALMSLMAAGVCAHVLVLGTRRRRRDLAILATLGFGGRQIRRAVGWQATTLVAVALTVAVPVGLVVSRLVWRTYAADLGVKPETAFPWAVLVFVVVGALLVANVIGFFPARAASRASPAAGLRSE